MSYSFSQRAHEIGIRLALGAQRMHILSMAIGEGMRLVAIGLAICLIGAAVLTLTHVSESRDPDATRAVWIRWWLCAKNEGRKAVEASRSPTLSHGLLSTVAIVRGYCALVADFSRTMSAERVPRTAARVLPSPDHAMLEIRSVVKWVSCFGGPPVRGWRHTSEIPPRVIA